MTAAVGIAQSGTNNVSWRNRIINGAMVIDQRNGGASVNVTSNTYTLDRWNGGGVNDGVLAFQQVSDAPTGFTNSLRITVSTADSSLGSTQYARVGQIIEGFNVSDFAAGTASAATITFSFWVKSSLTGTFGGYLSNGDETRVYVFQYTINAASTWEQKTVTIALPSSGTWATNNTAGMRAFFSLGAGSSNINTPNTWLTSYAQQASGNVNVINTLNATWQITGVQLERGTTATPFDYRDYGREQILCYRYFYRIQGASNSYVGPALYQGNGARQITVCATLPVTMRTPPSCTRQGSSGFATNDDSSYMNYSVVSAGAEINLNVVFISCTYSSGGGFNGRGYLAGNCHIDCSSEL